jgi:competence protein ComEC
VIDARLLIPAGTAWAGAAASLTLLGTVQDLHERHARSFQLILVVLIAVIGFSVVLWVRRHQVWVPAAFAGAVGLVVGVLAATAQVNALTDDPLASWVTKRATVVVTGVIGEEPITRVNSFAAPWESAHASTVRFATSSVEARGEFIFVDVPMVLRTSEPALVPPPGSEVRVSGKLGPAGPLRHAAANLTIAGPIEVLAAPGFIDVAADSMRQALRASVTTFAPDVGSLIAGLSIGDEYGAPPPLTDAMLGSGLSHLTAVSGGNVAIVVVVVLGIATLLRLPMPVRIAIAVMSVAFFVVLVRPQPSVLRASVMGGLVLIGMLTGGRRAGPSILATAVLVLMVISPHLAVAWGFALSVAATAGLILIAPWCKRWIDDWRLTRRWPAPIRNGLAITSAAQLATLPLLVAMGGAVGWVALPANLLAMPAVVPVTIFGLLAALIGPWVPALAVVSAALAAPGAWWIAQVAYVNSSLPGAKLPWPGGWLAAVALLAVLMALWWGRRYARIVLPMVLAVWVIWTIAPPDRRAWPPAHWLMVSCAVGQGDAHVIHVDSDSAVLIDVGPDPQAIDTCLTELGITTIPAIVISHFHADHVNGLSGALGGRDVGVILATPLREPAEQFAAVEQWRGDIPLEFIRFGETRSVGDVQWRALWPRRVIDDGSRPNNTSAVVLVQSKNHRMLFTGDIEPAAQSALFAELPPGGIDVMKVPHHGSRFQHPELPIRAPARIALFSVGEGNRYGHPAQETLDAWRHVGAVIGRTDIHGDLAVVTDPALGLVPRGPQ